MVNNLHKEQVHKTEDSVRISTIQLIEMEISKNILETILTIYFNFLILFLHSIYLFKLTIVRRLFFAYIYIYSVLCIIYIKQKRQQYIL